MNKCLARGNRLRGLYIVLKYKNRGFSVNREALLSDWAVVGSRVISKTAKTLNMGEKSDANR